MSAEDLDPAYAAARSTVGFVWTNLVSIVGVSLAWFLAAAPIVTIGPATVGAYAAILSLRDEGGDDGGFSTVDTGGHGGVDVDAVRLIVRRQFAHATLLGLIPPTLLAIAGAYGLAYARSGATTTGLLAIAALNAAIYAWLVSIPTFVELARGEAVVDAVGTGLRWSARHGVGAAALGIVTVALFTVTSLLTVAVALLFAGVAFAFHVEFVTSVSRADRLATPTPDP